MVKAKTIAVIGAGSSGIVTAKVLIDNGFDVILFDREKQIGGIWSPNGAYIDLQAQLVAGFMEFPDLIDTEGISSFISFLHIQIKCIWFLSAYDYARWQHLHNCLQKYSDKFHVTERIPFQMEVVLIDNYDIVVVATGLFSTPYVPTFHGQNKFAGRIFHAWSIKTEE